MTISILCSRCEWERTITPNVTGNGQQADRSATRRDAGYQRHQLQVCPRCNDVGLDIVERDLFGRLESAR